jgi:hypothetical protein
MMGYTRRRIEICAFCAKGRAFGKTLNARHARLGFSLAPGNKRADRFARFGARLKMT